MCIRLGIYSPKEGTSIEGAFQSHVQVHSPRIMDVIREVAIPGLNKYIVGRVVKEAIGKPSFTNYVHMTWDDESAMNRYLEALKVRMPFLGDDFGTKVNWHCTSFVEEKVAFENKSAVDTVAIRWGFYSPKKEVSVDEAFQSHVQVHSPRIMDVIHEVATPGLKKYVIGKVAEVAKGEPLFSNYVKMWWDDESAMNRYLETLEARRPLPGDDFGNMVDWGFTAFVKDEVIFQKK